MTATKIQTGRMITNMPTPKQNKNKGKAYERAVRDYLRNVTGLGPGDLDSAVGCENNVDIKLSPAARKLLPLSIECKARKDLDIPSWIRQAESNTMEGTKPCVVLKTPRKSVGESIVFLTLDNLLALMVTKDEIK